MRVRCLVLLLVTSCFTAPKWTGDVVVHPFARDSIKACGTGELTAEGAKKITRSPYLQNTTTRTTVVVWGSRDGVAQVVLREPTGEVVASAPAIYAAEAKRQQKRLAAQKKVGESIDPDDIYLVKAELRDLEPTHLYCYQLVVGDVALTEPAPLTTAPAPNVDKPIRFVAVGDTGDGGDAQRAIAKRMTEVPFDLMLFLGDIAYTSGTHAQIHNRFFQIYKNVLRYVPAFPAIGNHERRTQQGRPFFDAFVLPDAERYYSFDWGDVHFIAIDTTQYDAAQLRWLRDDLARNKLPWVIVFGHHPPYTSSLRGPQRAVRRAFGKIFTDHKVDLVLSGHEHHYERFSVGGVNYVVSGGGGGQLSYFRDSGTALKQAVAHHYLAFEVTNQVLEMKVIDIMGRQIERLRLTKDPAGGDTKVEVNDKPEVDKTPIKPEQETKPDETIHDGPDGDHDTPKVPESTAPVTNR